MSSGQQEAVKYYGHLPTGWTHEPFGTGNRWVTVREPRFGCMVTVDFEQRRFRGGMVHVGPSHSTKAYEKYGWRARLVADAVAWLQDVAKDAR